MEKCKGDLIQTLARFFSDASNMMCAIDVNNSFDRRIVYESVEALDMSKKRYRENLPRAICMNHRRRLVPGDEPCCGDIMCHGRCPETDGECHCEEVDSKVITYVVVHRKGIVYRRPHISDLVVFRME